MFRRLCELFLKGAVEDYRRAVYPPPVARQKETAPETKRESPREPGARCSCPSIGQKLRPASLTSLGAGRCFSVSGLSLQSSPAPLNSCYAIALLGSPGTSISIRLLRQLRLQLSVGRLSRRQHCIRWGMHIIYMSSKGQDELTIPYC